jgi:hypothetical protein
MRQVVLLVLLGACTNYAGGTDPTGDPSGDPTGTMLPSEHHARFVGLWAVTQPYHALYEQTHYWFNADGSLLTGASEPADCSGHLSEHCVTGSVANCVPPAPGQGSCTGSISCVFGDAWGSVDDATLVIAGDCSDGVSRPITLAFNPDSSMNAGFGANATIVSVDGNANWSHDNWDWAFQKCEDGVEATCPFGSPL